MLPTVPLTSMEKTGLFCGPLCATPEKRVTKASPGRIGPSWADARSGDARSEKNDQSAIVVLRVETKVHICPPVPGRFCSMLPSMGEPGSGGGDFHTYG